MNAGGRQTAKDIYDRMPKLIDCGGSAIDDESAGLRQKCGIARQTTNVKLPKLHIRQVARHSPVLSRPPRKNFFSTSNRCARNTRTYDANKQSGERTVGEERKRTVESDRLCEVRAEIDLVELSDGDSLRENADNSVEPFESVVRDVTLRDSTFAVADSEESDEDECNEDDDEDTRDCVDNESSSRSVHSVRNNQGRCEESGVTEVDDNGLKSHNEVGNSSRSGHQVNLGFVTKCHGGKVDRPKRIISKHVVSFHLIWA